CRTTCATASRSRAATSPRSRRAHGTRGRSATRATRSTSSAPPCSRKVRTRCPTPCSARWASESANWREHGTAEVPQSRRFGAAVQAREPAGLGVLVRKLFFARAHHVSASADADQTAVVDHREVLDLLFEHAL